MKIMLSQPMKGKTNEEIRKEREHLDSIYEKYCKSVNRNVEGFVVNYKNIITKYVRMKNGQLREHFDRGE